MSHQNTLRITDEFDVTLDVIQAPLADPDDSPMVTLRVNAIAGYAILLDTDDALALATWLTDWVVDQQKKSAVTS